MSKVRYPRGLQQGGRVVKWLLPVLVALAAYLGYGQSQGPDAKPEAQAQDPAFFEARVLKVADGDTLTVQDPDGARRKVRMFAIDAPELAQAHGQAAHAWLEKQVDGQLVKVRVVTVDKYQRLVAQVFVPNPQGCNTPEPLEPFLCEGDHDLNLAAVQAGHAWWYRFYSKEQATNDRVQYAGAEEEARGQRRGLWGQPNPQPPWDWRREHKR